MPPSSDGSEAPWIQCERLLFLLHGMPHGLIVFNQPLPLVHGLWSSRVDNQDPTVVKDDIPSHFSVSAAASHGPNTACVQGRDDVVNAMVNTLDTPIEWHTDLIP